MSEAGPFPVIITSTQTFGTDHADPDETLADPKIFVAVLCWATYSFALVARRTIGWSGRRTAWLSAIGFAIVLLNFVPVGYFLTRSHNF